MKKQIKGSLYGFLIGDALGASDEFKFREKLNKNKVTDEIDNNVRNKPQEFYSNFISMTLCTMQSIIDSKEINNKLMESMMNSYLKSVEEGYMEIDNKFFDQSLIFYKESHSLDSSTKNSFSKYIIDRFNLKLKSSDDSDGTLIRIFPLILYLYNIKIPKYKDEYQVYRKYDYISSSVDMTHFGLESNQTCIFYTMFIFNLLNTKDLHKAYDLSCDQHILWYSGFPTIKLKRILKKELLNISEKDIKSNGNVINTLEICLWCLFNSNSYEEAVLKAVNLGDTADTVGAITGSLAGFYYGYDSIPKKWIESLMKKELVDKTIEDFLEILEQKNNLDKE